MQCCCSKRWPPDRIGAEHGSAVLHERFAGCPSLDPPDGPSLLVLSSAGLIGLTGVNSAGMAICVNTLLMLRPNPDGLPVAAVMRHALAQRSVAEAQAVLETVPHA